MSETEIIPIDWEEYPNVDRRKALMRADWIMEGFGKGSFYRVETHSHSLLKMFGLVVPTGRRAVHDTGLALARSIMREEQESRRRWVTFTVAFEPDFPDAEDVTEAELVALARKRMVTGYPTITNWPVTVVYQGDKYGR